MKRIQRRLSGLGEAVGRAELALDSNGPGKGRDNEYKICIKYMETTRKPGPRRKATTGHPFPSHERKDSTRKRRFEIEKRTNGYHFCESQHSYLKYILINSYK